MTTDRLPDRPGSGQVRASLVVIGDELLNGHVTDANTPVLARAMDAAGVALERVHTVADDRNDIVSALRRELAAPRPRLLVTSGGIGSTPDDITFEAVAAALDVATEHNPVIAGRIRDSLDRQRDMGLTITDEISSAMLRMAQLPTGARLLTDVSGWVPAVVVDVDGSVAGDGVTVAILPGVPDSFAHIVTEGLVAMVAGRNPVPAVVEVEHGLPESLLNPVFARVGREFPEVRLGSYPGRPMLVRLIGTPDQAHLAAEMVQAYLDDLLRTEPGRRIAARWGGRDTTRLRTSDDAMAAPVDRDTDTSH